MAAAPTPEELGPLLGETGSLDQPAAGDMNDSESGEFDAAAIAAVGTRAKASALKDAILACLRENGLLADSEADEAPADDTESDEIPY